MRKIRKGRQCNFGWLKTMSGELVGSDSRCDTFAEYLQEVQRAVRPASLVDNGPPQPDLPVNLGSITRNELEKAVRAFKSGKAAGPDNQPIEYWRAVLRSSTSHVGVDWLLEFVNSAWGGKQVPDNWHLQTVAMIFKKGDDAVATIARYAC
jgi:hypothetical protein